MVQVRRAGADDLRAILVVERPSVGSPYWSEAVWIEVLAADADARAVFVAEFGERLVGFVVLGRAADVVEIESIAVADDVRRQGVGKELCLAGIRWARDVGAADVQLEVRASNRGGRALYKSLGMMEQGTRQNYYSAPTENAVLMGMGLKAVEVSAKPAEPKV